MIKVRIEQYKSAATLVNHLIDTGVIQKLILDREEGFDIRFTSISNYTIGCYTDLYSNFDTDVVLYKPINPFSAAYATTYTGNYKLIKLNSRKLNRHSDVLENIASLAGSIAHELGHCLEYYITEQVHPRAVFNHGDNSPVGKENTFQYWLGRVVKEYIMSRREKFHELLRYS